LILRKIFKTVAARWQIFRLKYTKFVVGRGSAPKPLGDLTALAQTLYLDLRGPTSKGRGGERGREGTPTPKNPGYVPETTELNGKN